MNADVANGPGGDDLATSLSELIASGATPELDPRELAKTAYPGRAEEELRERLDAFAAVGRVLPADKVVCPLPACGLPLSVDDVDGGRCPHCGADYRETGDEPVTRTIYRVVGGPSRDIEWMVVAHGMNTRGPWQEELSWRLSNKFRYSAPVLIYKYGLVRFGVLFSFRHRALARTWGQSIRRGVRFARQFGRQAPPDVILHSFGTLLFARLLDDDEFRDLRFGRVILAGSIVRPDYNWSTHIDSGRVEAILNHCGTDDRVVNLAEPVIPNSGPSGRVGVRDPAVFSISARGYDHATFFQDRGLAESLIDGGLWDRFLRLPLQVFENARMSPEAAINWRPLPILVRGALQLVVLILLGAVLFVGLEFALLSERVAAR